jgi:hypothetical protein
VAGDELVKVLLHERRVGQSTIQYWLIEAADCRLAPAGHRQATSKALTATLAGDSHVDTCVPQLSVDNRRRGVLVQVKALWPEQKRRNA